MKHVKMRKEIEVKYNIHVDQVGKTWIGHKKLNNGKYGERLAEAKTLKELALQLALK